MRPLLFAGAALAAALVPGAAGLVVPFEKPDGCAVAVEGTCEFVCRLNHPLLLVATGAGTASIACEGGLHAFCSLDPGQVCGDDFTAHPRGYGLGTCRGDGHVAVFCGSPVPQGPLAGV